MIARRRNVSFQKRARQCLRKLYGGRQVNRPLEERIDAEQLRTGLQVSVGYTWREGRWEGSIDGRVVWETSHRNRLLFYLMEELADKPAKVAEP